MAAGFLPVSGSEMNALGWERLDILLVSGDAYVDHPSFGVAVIARVLEGKGYRVGVLPQPDWKNPGAFLEMGVPEEWIPVLQKLGYTTIGKLKQVDKPAKLSNDLNGYNKKNKLGLKGISPGEVEDWIKK